jgi:hypothetical protein
MGRAPLGFSLAVIAVLTVAVSLGVDTRSQSARWYKGNTHTHTLNSDGDSTPDDVVRWYREHGISSWC